MNYSGRDKFCKLLKKCHVISKTSIDNKRFAYTMSQLLQKLDQLECSTLVHKPEQLFAL